MKLLTSELVKLRTIRTPYVLLLGVVLISGGVAAGLVGSGSVDRGDDDPALSLGQGASFGTIFMAVLGILIVTNEYRHGTIMTTFLTEPHRVRVLLAKLATAAIAGLVFALTALAVAAAVALPWLAARGESLQLDGQALEAVGRSLLVFSLTAVFGAALGAIVQSQVGAIVGYFVWILVVESIITVLAGLVLTDIGEPDPVSKFLPGSSLGGIIGGEGERVCPAGRELGVARGRLCDRPLRARRSVDDPARSLARTLRRWPRPYACMRRSSSRSTRSPTAATASRA